MKREDKRRRVRWGAKTAAQETGGRKKRSKRELAEEKSHDRGATILALGENSRKKKRNLV